MIIVNSCILCALKPLIFLTLAQFWIRTNNLYSFKFSLNSALQMEFLFILVAKKKSLFDDRPMEIQELTYIIKQVWSANIPQCKSRL